MVKQTPQEQSSTTFQPAFMAWGALHDTVQSFWKTQVQAIEAMQQVAIKPLHPVSAMTEQNRRERSPVPSQPFAVGLEALQKSAHLAWTTQVHVLDVMQLFAEGWFQRRRAAVRSGQEACGRMCSAKTPVEYFHAYQLWSMGAFQRLLADGLAFQEGMKTIASDLTPPLVPEIAEEQNSTLDSRTRNVPPPHRGLTKVQRS